MSDRCKQPIVVATCDYWTEPPGVYDPVNYAQVWPVKTTIDRIRAYLVVALNYLYIERAVDDYGVYHCWARALCDVLDYAAGVACPWTLPDEPEYVVVEDQRPRKTRPAFSRWSLPVLPAVVEPPKKRRGAKSAPADVASRGGAVAKPQGVRDDATKITQKKSRKVKCSQCEHSKFDCNYDPSRGLIAADGTVIAEPKPADVVTYFTCEKDPGLHMPDVEHVCTIGYEPIKVKKSKTLADESEVLFYEGPDAGEVEDLSIPAKSEQVGLKYFGVRV